MRERRGLESARRLVIDFAPLSKVIVDDSDVSKIHLTNISTEMACLSRCRYTSTIDVKSGFPSLRVCPTTSRLMSFTSYKLGVIMSCSTLQLGLSLSPSLFMQCLSHILAEYTMQNSFCPKRIMALLKKKEPPPPPPNNEESCHSIYEHINVHVDDVVIRIANGNMLSAAQELILQVSIIYQLFSAFERSGLLVNYKKLKLLRPSTQKLTVLGYQICNNKIEIPDEKRLLIGKSLKLPSTRQELLCFLGTMIYYSCFVKNFSGITRILYSLLKKDVPFIMTPEHIQACNTIKTSILNSCSLYLLKNDETLYLISDSSSNFYGSVLGHIIDGEFQIVRFLSGCFNRKFISAGTSAVLELAGITLSVLQSSYIIKQCICRV